ncbi:phosphohydrolase [Veronia pacifica]|uniref:Phosphohydrolase n=2 Tax=Veronia pacifica TaxID=1080227 RepID=A0A1C3ELD1_9GAMM|nr:phosphohydrolase [Veronia pacifica]
MVYSSLALSLGLSAAADASISQHRVMWDADPAREAVIGVTQSQSSDTVTIRYGQSTDESTWKQVSPTHSASFKSRLNSHFTRLEDLQPDSPVYYQVCEKGQCGDKFWFKTAPTDHSPFVFVAGGDTRTGWTNRRQGNRLVAKTRPLFVMHGGDFTDSNSASQMSQFLDDWTLTYSDDVIESENYKRIYPLIPTHGNHEDGNYSTLCQVFGVDPNKDGKCDYKDTYSAFSVSPLLRVYTLNSQFKNSGWGNAAKQMNQWLETDLSSKGDSAKWRIAQYHKPMFPHYTGKSDNDELHEWWADTFYQHKMNLVVESDTHINKITKALKPTTNGFAATTQGGTVFVGEGSWGAPARSANDPKLWTIDLASIQQFKIIQVETDKMQVRTAQFDDTAQTLTREERAANPLLVPAGVNWWQAADIGDKLQLVRNDDQRSVIDNSVEPPKPPVEQALENGNTVNKLSATERNTLLFYIDVPAEATSLKFEMSGGYGDADLYVRALQAPTDKSYDCRPYKEGNEERCIISSPQTGRYFVMLYAYESFSDVSLTATYRTDDKPEPVNRQVFTDLSGDEDSWQFQSFEVPAEAKQFTARIEGGSGDADLYVRKSIKPKKKKYDCRPYEEGNDELCEEENEGAATWWVGLFGYEDFRDVTLTLEWQ